MGADLVHEHGWVIAEEDMTSVGRGEFSIDEFQAIEL